MGRKFYDEEFDVEVEALDYCGKPAVKLSISHGTYRSKFTMTLEDTETLADMLIAAVRESEEQGIDNG